MIVCSCRAVSDRTVRQIIARGADSVDEVAAGCGAGGGCGACRPMIAELLHEAVCGEHERCAGCPRAAASVSSPYLLASSAA